MDDDSFLNLPRLEAALAQLACVTHLYYGGGGYAGYHPTQVAANPGPGSNPNPPAVPGSCGPRPRTAAPRPGTAAARPGATAPRPGTAAAPLGRSLGRTSGYTPSGYTPSGYKASPGAAAPAGVGVASPWDMNSVAQAAKAALARIEP